jgi:LysR family glycine cleavage system transcriptional activator
LRTAARHASFTRAAEELGLTQAAISRHIRNLEDEIGVQLFRRTHRAVTLTEAGRRYAKQVAQGFRALRYRASGLQDRTERIVLEVDSLLCRYWLLPRLHRSGPDLCSASLDIRIHSGSSQILPIDTDIALTRGAHDREGFKRFRLLSPRLIGVAAPTLQVRSLTEVDTVPLIHFRSDEDWRLLRKAAATTSSRSQTDMTFDRPGHVIDAARLGFGLAACEDVMVAGDVDAGRLVIVEGASLTCRSYYMATRKPRLSPDASAFAKWLMHQADEVSEWQVQHRTSEGSAAPNP